MFLIKIDGAVPIPQNSIIVAIPFVNESGLIAMKVDVRNNRAVFWTTAHPLSCAVLLSPHFRDDWCAPTSRARFNSHVSLLLKLLGQVQLRAAGAADTFNDANGSGHKNKSVGTTTGADIPSTEIFSVIFALVFLNPRLISGFLPV